MTEKPYRSMVKAVSWRATGTLDTILISFLITRKLEFALSIGVVELFTKMLLYYVHERIWNRLSFGREQPPEDYAI
jgi:uncharacterized membrane protein